MSAAGAGMGRPTQAVVPSPSPALDSDPLPADQEVMESTRNPSNRDERMCDRGASAVEFALVLPLLTVLVFGIIDFGYFFGQFNEVRHAAREGARIAAVSNTDFDQDADSDFDAEDIRLYVCDVLNLSGQSATVNLTQSGTTVGSEATVQVVLDSESLSGALNLVIPSTVASTATFRLEVVPTWSVPATPGTCP